MSSRSRLGHTADPRQRSNLEDPMAFYPYLNFGGNCREAFTRYQEIFGGELVVLTMADMPGNENAPAEQANLVMHAALQRGDDVLMASDDVSGSFASVQGAYVNYSVDDQ